MKRARIKRSGKDFYLPVRTSSAARARDQELLDAVDKKSSLQEVEEAVSKIRRQRDEELARGGVESSSQGETGAEEAEKAVALIGKQREDEVKSSVAENIEARAAKRARIKRSGKDFYLPVRTSSAALARDQELLDAVDKNSSWQEVEEAVSKIRRQRDEELARGGVESSSQGETGGQRKQRRTSVETTTSKAVGSFDRAVLQAQHLQMCEEA